MFDFIENEYDPSFDVEDCDVNMTQEDSCPRCTGHGCGYCLMLER